MEKVEPVEILLLAWRKQGMLSKIIKMMAQPKFCGGNLLIKYN